MAFKLLLKPKQQKYLISYALDFKETEPSGLHKTITTNAFSKTYFVISKLKEFQKCQIYGRFEKYVTNAKYDQLNNDALNVFGSIYCEILYRHALCRIYAQTINFSSMLRFLK